MNKTLYDTKMNRQNPDFLFSFIAIVHELWHYWLHKEELMNTLTCQWCALVIAGFVSVDGFNNKLADSAFMLKTKGMWDETFVSKNEKTTPFLFKFFSYYCTHLGYQCQVYVEHWES